MPPAPTADDFPRQYGYWADMLNAVLNNPDGTAPKEVWATDYSYTTEIGDIEGVVKIHRTDDPGPFEIFLTGGFVTSNQDVDHAWELACAKDAFDALLHGTVLDAQPKGDGLRLTYDPRPKIESVPDFLPLHWAGQVEAIMRWIKDRPFPDGLLNLGRMDLRFPVDTGNGIFDCTVRVRTNANWPEFEVWLTADCAWDVETVGETLESYLDHDAYVVGLQVRSNGISLQLSS